ncbi:MAG: peptidase S41 [Bacteroidetes bacterium HGW-Bacteroidetes-17]|nr:MAG: peptidase S41 [Bacteroidetes bacterium HGW-Bacteroidetes-17]
MNLIRYKKILKVGFLTNFLLFTMVMANAQVSVDENLRKLATAMQIIHYAYVDTVNESKLVENAIIETLKELDPHSYYISKEDLEAVNEPLVSSFEGIGISFQIYNDTLMVIAPIIGGPSEKVGILAGDKIVEIDGEKSYGDKIDNQFVFDHLRGPKGSKVKVLIYRKGKSELLNFTITRDKIPMNSIDATFMVDDEIGYIKLSRFAQTSHNEFRESIALLQSKGMKKLIFDLRGNGGGLMQPAIEISDEFLKAGRLIVYTEGINSPIEEYNATSGGSLENEDLVLMIDEGSASASEIVAGAIQDWDRGIVLGRRSFGKGLVQRPFQLPDGSVIRLTTARYYTPTGRSIQKPYEEGIEKYYTDLYDRLKNGEFVHADSIHFPDSLRYYTPGKRLVYGGGGIMPDVFIPWDSTTYSDYYIDLVREGAFNDFALKFVDENRNQFLAKYKSMEAYVKNFDIDKKIFSEFIAFADAKSSKKHDEDSLTTSEMMIKHVLKGLIGRNLYTMDAYFKVMTEIDDGFIKAVEVLKDKKIFAQIKK